MRDVGLLQPAMQGSAVAGLTAGTRLFGVAAFELLAPNQNLAPGPGREHEGRCGAGVALTDGIDQEEEVEVLFGRFDRL